MFLYNMTTHDVDWVDDNQDIELTDVQKQRIEQGKAEIRLLSDINPETGRLMPVKTYIDRSMVRIKPRRKPVKPTIKYDLSEIERRKINMDFAELRLVLEPDKDGKLKWTELFIDNTPSNIKIK